MPIYLGNTELKDINLGSNDVTIYLGSTQVFPGSALPTYLFSQWSGTCTATAAGVSSCTDGGADSATTTYNSAAATLQDNCGSSTLTVANQSITVDPPAGYSNSDSTVSGTGNVVQTNWPRRDVGNPSDNGPASATGGTVSVTSSGYSGSHTFGARGFNSGCSNRSATLSWTYTVTGNYCNSTDTGTKTVYQSPHPQVNVGNPTQSGVVPGTGGTPSYTNSKYASSSIAARGFNSGCSNTTVNNVAWTYTETSGNFCNNTDTGTVNITQGPLPEFTATDPSGSVAQNGAVTFTGSNASEYASNSTISANTGCAKSVDVNYTQTVTSGSYCNNSDTGTVSFTQAKLAGSVSLTASSTNFSNAGGTQTVATITAAGCDTGYSVTQTPSWATSCVISGTNLNCTVPANSGAANGPSNVEVTRDGATDTVAISQAAAVTCSFSGISVGTGGSANAACASAAAPTTMNFNNKTFLNATAYYGTSTNCTLGSATWISDGTSARQWTGTGFASVSQLCLI